MNETIAQALQELRALGIKHEQAWKEAIREPNEEIYSVDFYLISALNRSYCLLRGFCDLIETRNFIAAAPLVRLQLDTCARINALTLVDDPYEFAADVLDGKQINKIKDRSGTKMTDRHLVECLAQEYSWIDDVYQQTSAYIHFSNKHLWNVLGPTVSQDEMYRTVILKVTNKDEFIPDAEYLNAIRAFRQLTDLLLEFASAWTSSRAEQRMKGQALP